MSGSPYSIERYSPAAYLLDEKAALAVCAACLACVSALLTVLGLGAHAVVLVCAVVALAFAACLGWGYTRRARYYRGLAEIARQVDNARLVFELVDEPAFLDGRISHQATAALVSLCGWELAEERERSQGYHEYVERWIHEVKTPIATAKLLLVREVGSVL